VVEGSQTLLATPRGIAFGPDGLLYVANSASNSILVFDRGAFGNTPPARRIAGSLTQLAEPTGLGFDPFGRLYVANASPNPATGFPAVTAYRPGAQDNEPPERRISGPNTGLSVPRGVALDPVGTLYVANSGADSVTVYTPGATEDSRPVRVVVGPRTGLRLPWAVAVRP
jgi:DNA-binding beta-propeller fold protein YncE